MLDHDTRLRCQQREGLLILRGERAIAPFGPTIGTPKNDCIGGCPGGKPTLRGSS
jgi:hypothetical protein